MHKRPIVPIVIVLTAVLAATLYFEVFRNLGKNGSKVEGSGTIEVTEIEISSKLAGRIAEIPFDEGVQVKKGDLIVKLEYEELNAQLRSALANFVNSDENFKRTRDLFQKGSLSKRDFDNAEAAYKVAKASLDLVSANIGNAVLFSPIDGTVLEKNLEVGEMAFPGSAIVTVADIKKPWMKIYVSDKILGKVKLGQKALVQVDSFPGRNFTGIVSAISSKAEFTPKTIQTKEERVKLMFAVKIAIDNPGLDLKPGMPADAEIQTEAK